MMAVISSHCISLDLRTTTAVTVCPPLPLCVVATFVCVADLFVSIVSHLCVHAGVLLVWLGSLLLLMLLRLLEAAGCSTARASQA